MTRSRGRERWGWFETAGVGETHPGMSPTQALVHELKEAAAKGGGKFVEEMVEWVERSERTRLGRREGWWNKGLDAIERIVPTEKELAERWFILTVTRVLVDEGYDVGGRYRRGGRKTDGYYRLVAETERSWKRFCRGGRFEAEVRPGGGRVGVISRDDNNARGGGDMLVAIGRAYDVLSHSRLARGMVLTAVLATQAGVLEACRGNRPVATEVVEAIAAPTARATKTREPIVVAMPTPTPTPRPTEAARPTPTPLPETRIKAVGGEYTVAEKKVMAGEAYREKLKTLRAWFNYWSLADNRAFNYESLEVGEKPIWDDPNNPAEAAPMLEARMDDGWWHTFTVPRADWGRVAPVPRGSYFIAAGDGPLELTAGDPKLGLRLAFVGGEFVRLNAGGEVVERVNDEGVWEEVYNFKMGLPESYETMNRLPGWSEVGGVEGMKRFIQEEIYPMFEVENMSVDDVPELSAYGQLGIPLDLGPYHITDAYFKGITKSDVFLGYVADIDAVLLVTAYRLKGIDVVARIAVIRPRVNDLLDPPAVAYEKFMGSLSEDMTPFRIRPYLDADNDGPENPDKLVGQEWIQEVVEQDIGGELDWMVDLSIGTGHGSVNDLSHLIKFITTSREGLSEETILAVLERLGELLLVAQ